MKTLQEFVIEKLKIKKSSTDKIQVKDYFELRRIVKQRYEENNAHIDCSDLDVSEIETLAELFSNLNNVVTIDITGWETSKVTSMYRMFNDCYSLERIIGIDDLDVSSVENMSYVFWNNAKLASLDLSKWNTHNVYSMAVMFYNCIKLEEIVGIENFDLSKTSNINAMFKECNALKKLDLSKWAVSAVQHVEQLFFACTNLEELNLSNWKLNVSSSEYMFNICKNLKKLNLTGFEFDERISDMKYMFNRCESLEHIEGDIEDWDVHNVKYFYGMFQDCPKLKVDLSKWEFNEHVSKAKMNYGSKGVKLPKRKK